MFCQLQFVNFFRLVAKNTDITDYRQVDLHNWDGEKEEQSYIQVFIGQSKCFRHVDVRSLE